MSIATKRKHVTKEVTDEFALPEGDRQIVKVLAGRGNNLHEVENDSGKTFLVSMPTKFRKNVWIKRGDFVMCVPIEEGDKVKAEITHILYKEQIKYIKSEGQWPQSFGTAAQDEVTENTIPSDMLPPSDSEEEGEDIVINPNRQVVQHSESESDSELEEESR